MHAQLRITSPLAARAIDADRDDLQLIGVAKTFAVGQQVFGEGDKADYVFKVVSGAVRAVQMLADGRRQIAEFYLPGDVFGIELGGGRRMTAEAIGDIVLVVARRTTLTNDAARLWRHALAGLERAQAHMLTLGRRSASERVAHFLTDLVERTGADGVVELPMSRQDMADYLGLTIETVSRTLTQLQSQGAIEVRGCRSVRLLQPAALAELCE